MTKIMIVEDNEMNMRLFADLLKTQKYQVVACANGRRALAMAIKERPDLILMDIQMPGISGLDVTRLIRKTPDIKDTKIVAVTAFAMKGDEKKILSGGCNGYIAKPIEVKSFLSKIADTLANPVA